MESHQRRAESEHIQFSISSESQSTNPTLVRKHQISEEDKVASEDNAEITTTKEWLKESKKTNEITFITKDGKADLSSNLPRDRMDTAEKVEGKTLEFIYVSVCIFCLSVCFCLFICVCVCQELCAYVCVCVLCVVCVTVGLWVGKGSVCFYARAFVSVAGGGH